MNDGPGSSSDDGLPEIDVRSPGERWADSGRAGFQHANEYMTSLPVGAAATVWLVALAAIMGSNTYQVFTFSSFGGAIGTWDKLFLFSQTGSFSVAVATLAGLALAALSPESRAASIFGLLLGLWLAVASVCGFATTVHGQVLSSSLSNNRVAYGIAELGELALALVVIGVGWVLVTRGSPEIGIAEVG